MKKLAILVHGIHAENKGKSTTRKLVPYLHKDKWEVQDFDYGWKASIEALFSSKHAAKLLRKALISKCYEGYDVITVIGHSHGCEIIAKTSDLLDKSDLPNKRPKLKAALINPALESDRVLGNAFEEVDVWYTPDDNVVLVAQFIPFIPWGQMGRTGFMRHEDETPPPLFLLNQQIVINRNIRDLAKVNYIGHKGFFSPFVLRKCMPAFLASLNC